MKKEEVEITMNLQVNFNKPQQFEAEFIEKAHNMTFSNNDVTRALGHAFKCMVPGFCGLITLTNNRTLNREEALQAMVLAVANFTHLWLQSMPVDMPLQAANILTSDFGDTLIANLTDGKVKSLQDYRKLN
jgi:hypothetical protein